MYIEIILFGSACFLSGWAMKSIAVSELISKAKTDIKYIDTLTRNPTRKAMLQDWDIKGGLDEYTNRH